MLKNTKAGKVARNYEWESHRFKLGGQGELH